MTSEFARRFVESVPPVADPAAQEWRTRYMIGVGPRYVHRSVGDLASSVQDFCANLTPSSTVKMVTGYLLPPNPAGEPLYPPPARCEQLEQVLDRHLCIPGVTQVYDPAAPPSPQQRSLGGDDVYRVIRDMNRSYQRRAEQTWSQLGDAISMMELKFTEEGPYVDLMNGETAYISPTHLIIAHTSPITRPSTLVDAMVRFVREQRRST